MNGVTFKAILMIFAALNALILPSVGTASKDIYRSKAGCMSCHQNRTPKTDTEIKKKYTKKKAYAKIVPSN